MKPFFFLFLLLGFNLQVVKGLELLKTKGDRDESVNWSERFDLFEKEISGLKTQIIGLVEAQEKKLKESINTHYKMTFCVGFLVGGVVIHYYHQPEKTQQNALWFLNKMLTGFSKSALWAQGWLNNTTLNPVN